MTTSVVFSQPFTDLINYNSQFCHTTYTDSLRSPNSTNDNILNLIIPKKFSNGNILIIRANAEQLNSARKGSVPSSSQLFAFAVPVGFQFFLRDKHCSVLLMAMPKIAGDMRDDLSHDMQFGGTGILSYVKDERFRLRLGLYYNRECFGNFFVPLAGMDWKATDRLYLYGLLPNNYRIEFKCSSRIFTGLGFRSFQRSYRLSATYGNDLVRVKENLLKIFLDYYLTKRIVLFAEGSYSIGYSLLEYDHVLTTARTQRNPVYSEMENGFLFNAGLAFRIRNDQ